MFHAFIKKIHTKNWLVQKSLTQSGSPGTLGSVGGGPSTLGLLHQDHARTWRASHPLQSHGVDFSPQHAEKQRLDFVLATKIVSQKSEKSRNSGSEETS